MKLWTIIFLGVLAFSGCSDPMAQGIAIGVGASAGAEETQKLAQENKMVLVAEVLRLRHEVEAAPTVEDRTILEAKLLQAEKKQEIAALTETISNNVVQVLQKDWSSKDPQTQSENWALIAGLAASVLYGGKKTYDTAQLTKAVSRVKIASKSEQEQKIYQALNQGA